MDSPEQEDASVPVNATAGAPMDDEDLDDEDGFYRQSYFKTRQRKRTRRR